MTEKPSEQLLHALAPFRDVVVVAHNNPDPDAMASGWALCRLIDECSHQHVRLVAGGGIFRAENRHMLSLLDVPIEIVDDLELADNTAYVLVDCGAAASNHLLSEARDRVVAVVDHHQGEGGEAKVAFRDRRTQAAANASICASYLREQGVQPGANLATALLYGIRTETRGGEWEHSGLDRSVILWLTPLADPSRLAEIEDAPLPVVYYTDMVLAMQNTFVYDDVAFCMLPSANGPETVGEVADLLSRCEEVRRVLCGARLGADVILSARTNRAGDDATDLLLATIAGLGRGGGHEHRAGGIIHTDRTGEQVQDALQDELRGRWLAACGVNRQRGTRLVALRQIVSNL